ncbi:EAL domain-containing protein [Salibacterium halotolerans]|uniref:EAL domain-containing protein n=1 Tax=Salibacterium halotolerans TaxID=1884432 RepID=UPI000B87403F|nr:EAL domain-containing protein [Salibacterium halotolerans]
MEQGSREKAIVDAIIHLAHRLEFNVIAEGIENEASSSCCPAKTVKNTRGTTTARRFPRRILRNDLV